MSDAASIFQIWGNHSGYVFLPRKLRGDSQAKGSKNHGGKWEESQPFKWPEQKQQVVDWIQDSHRNKYDLYWCPTVFARNRRVKESLDELSCLYADLDEVNPAGLPKDLRPTMAWESSPGRYAAVWKIKEPLSPRDGEELNKRMTYAIGADKGGWDLTQVLRVPGLHNYKYEGAPVGKLLWLEKREYDSRSLNLPPVEFDDLEEKEISDDVLLESEPALLPELVRPYLSKLNSKTLELLFVSVEDVLLNDRSAKLWELECKLLESGVPRDAVVKLVAACNWNKYKGRRDEVKRIITEVDKAAEEVGKPSSSRSYDFGVKEWTDYDTLMGKQMEQAEWMIEGFWQKSSHGMIAGEPKTYKSVIVTDMAVSVASGTPFLNKFPVPNPGPVLFIQEENSPWLVQDRMMKIANSRGLLDGKVNVRDDKHLNIRFPPSLPISFLNNKGFDLTNEDDQQFLEEAVKEVQPVLVIFDSLYLMLGGKDENSSKDLRPVLNWLLHLRYDYHTSIIILHHWNKNGKSERGGQRMLGSVLFHAWVESAVYTAVVNETEHEIEVEREFRSFTKPQKLDIKFVMGDPGNLMYAPQVSDAEIKVQGGDAVYDFIVMMKAVSAQEIVESVKGVKKRGLKERLDKLVEDGKVTVDSNGVYRPTSREDDLEDEQR